jgi:uncharacterized phage protein (TIGR01671 family)
MVMGMREILFRGKRMCNGKMMFGSLMVFDGDDCYIVGDDFHHSHYRIHPKTVGQFTGLTDKNGKNIFEGDIIEWDELEWGSKHREVVTWDYNLFAIRKDDWGEWCEVIGNIHDSPELIGGQGVCVKS